MSLDDYVVITITRDAVGVTQPGFGIPMILGYSATWTDRLRYYEDLPSMVADSFSTSSPEYLAAEAAFSQNPRPTQIAIGRGTNKPTQVYVIGVASVQNNTVYNLDVVAPGASPTNPVTFTSSGSATNDNIIAGIVAALNGVSGKNYTAAATGSSGTMVCTVTGSAAGNWFSIEIESLTLLDSKQTSADPGVAADLTAIALAQPTWYGLYTFFNSQAIVTAAAAWIEANARIYLPDVVDTLAVTTSGGDGGTGDTLDALCTSNYTRTMGSYHPIPAEMFGAAWLGRVLPTDPGSATWKFKTLAGVSATVLTETQRGNLLSRHGNGIESIASLSITFEGTVADGEYLDAIVGDDWVKSDMQLRIFNVLVGVDKVEYEDTGIALVEAAVRASLAAAVDRKIYAATPKTQVSVPTAASVDSGSKSTRTLPNVKWTATRSGAIHKVLVQGTVSI